MAVLELAGTRGMPEPTVTDEGRVPVDVAGKGRNLQEEQAAAAAIAAAPADASDALATPESTDVVILPTEAPLGAIGALAQAPAPAASEAAPATVPTPPPAEAGTAPVSPWIIGGAGLLGVGLLAAIANDDDDDLNPVPPPAEPPPVEPPPEVPPPAPPPENALPTGSDKAIQLPGGNATLTSADFGFTDADGDAFQSVTIASVTPNFTDSATAIYDAATGHGYRYVTGGPSLSWEQANEAATAAGGHLLVIDSAEELALVRDSFDVGESGTTGAWIGLSQDPAATAVDGAWSWVSLTGVERGGPAFTNASAIWQYWNEGEPNDTNEDEADHADQWGAIFAGEAGPDDLNLIYDWDVNGLSSYIIEYEGALTLDGVAVGAGTQIDVAALDAGTLAWSSLFNGGGTVTFNVTDSQGGTSAAPNTLTFEPALGASAPGSGQALAILIEDPHLSALA